MSVILLEALAFAALYLAASRLLRAPWKARAHNVLKLGLTVEMVRHLVFWEFTQPDGTTATAWALIVDVVREIDLATFLLFVGIGAAIRFAGIACSMLRWQLVLRGQGVDFPFRHVFGSFLIGRAIGFFLPSTAGLDAYLLYDGARFSGRTVEVTAGKFLEKVIGFSGIFLSFLVALPFGIGIFGEHGLTVAAITVPIASGVIVALMTVLFFPGLVQWVLVNVPIPAKARLQGLLTRLSQAAAAYRDKKGLVVMLFALSFAVHFTTASMYYFTALAVGAQAFGAFWEVVFGSSIQIFATVIGPTIGGIGIREAAQTLTLGSLIGPGVAIVSAALGFWVGEAPTFLGFLVWMIRGDDYRPAYCRVDGTQVDYDEAAKAALELEPEGLRGGGAPAPAFALSERLKLGAAYGLGAGLLGGLVLALAEAGVVVAGGLGTEAQVLWWGPLAYAALFGGLGLAGGLVLALLPMDREEVRGWTVSLALLGAIVPFGLFATVFRLRRDVFGEQMPPMPVLLGVLAAFGALALALFLLGPRLFRGRAGAAARPLPALGILAAVALSGLVAAHLAPVRATKNPSPPPVPSELAERPNLILLMVDTLRADHLSCYGAEQVETPHMCGLVEDGGSIYSGFAHASWTKPSAATLLTSLLPTSHQAETKPAMLPDAVTTVGEALSSHGYTTGAFVSNTNMTASFGFAQGFDEYHYLGPDYLAGAKESSSKLILYQLARRVWFKLPMGLHFGDFYQDSRVVNDRAFEWLDRHEDSRFFLFLHYMDPHDPYFRHPYDGYGIARAGNQDPDPSSAPEMSRLYRGEVEYADESFGRLLEALRERDLYEDTAIVLVSDHGEEFHEHGGFWHGLTLYEEQIHVPLLVKWPEGERRAEPEKRGTPARLIDVAPTLLRSAGAEVPATMQGRDLAEELSERPEKDRMVFAEEDHEGNVLRAIRAPRWKWIEANEGNPRGLPPEELFDLERDPGETVNRLEERPELATELRSHAEGHQEFARQNQVGDADEAELSAAEREQLEALGYVVPEGGE